uniref:Protein kinase domain-containing protein n=1 Tax=Ganoderma boninense TaxID=34458 RepID=A0A5K1K4E9_9APHY|nr:Protein kinase domain-containing protein [Ganoderma boninense]
MLDFVSRIARSGRARDWFDGENFSNLVNLVFSWAQMTQSDEEEWADNANAFVAQEADDSFSYSVRVAGFDLLGVLLERNTIPTIKAFQVAIEHVITQAQQQRESGSQDWYNIPCASTAALKANERML